MIHSPRIPGNRQIVARIVLIIFVIEVLVMLALMLLDMALSGVGEAFVDALALGLLSTPFLYYWVIKPFVDTNEQAQESLKASEQHLLAAQRVARVGSWQLQHGDGQLAWSDEVFSIFEQDPERIEPNYESFIQRVHPDDRGRVEQAFADSVTQRTAYQVEHRLLLDDGRIKYVCERGETSYDQHDSPVLSTGTVVDITQQVEAQQQIEKERRKAQNYLNIANVLMVALDREGRVTMVNPMCCEAMKMSEQELLGVDWIERFFLEQEKDAMKNTFRDVMEGRSRLPELHENSVKTELGQTILVSWHNSLIYGEDGEIIGTLSSGHDITEQRKAEETLAQSQQETEIALEQLSELSLKLQSEVAQRQQAEMRMTQISNIEPLTQLPSRQAVRQRLLEQLRQDQDQPTLGLISLKLLGLDEINRQQGPEVGDAVIVEASIRIREATAEQDIVFRSYGSGFSIILTGAVDGSQVERYASALARTLEQPFESVANGQVASTLRFCLARANVDNLDGLLNGSLPCNAAVIESLSRVNEKASLDAIVN